MNSVKKYQVKPKPAITLLDFLLECKICDKQRRPLSKEFIRILEKSIGGSYDSYQLLDYGSVSIFLTNPQSCSHRTISTIRLDLVWGDTSALAFLDLDQEGQPVSLDIIPIN